MSCPSKLAQNPKLFFSVFKIKIENFFFLGKDPYSFTRSYSENKFLQGFGSILKDNFIEIKKKNSENVFLFCRNSEADQEYTCM